MFLERGGDLRVAREQAVQFMAPAAPVGAEHEQDALVLLAGPGDGIGHQLRAVGLRVVDCRTPHRCGIRQ
jgi:hypothetical protein